MRRAETDKDKGEVEAKLIGMEGSVCFGFKWSVLSSFATLSVETISGPKQIVHSCSYEHEDLGPWRTRAAVLA